MRRVFRFLSSTGLTIGICLALAAVGIAGSLLYYGDTAFGNRGYLNLFRTPLFLVPAFLLILNILFCAAARLSAMPAGAVRTWTFSGIHLGVVLLVGGMAVDGMLGFVGTGYFFVGTGSSGYHDWRERRDAKLPFRVEVTGADVQYHPLTIRIGIKDASGNKRALYTVREGVPFRVAVAGLTVIPRRFEIPTKTLVFDVRDGERTVSGLRAVPGGSAPVGGWVVVPVAFKDPEPSGYTARIAFLDADGRRVEKVARANDPAVHAGISFCVTAFGADGYGNRYVGLQLTREPGQGLFWVGGILFCLSVLGHFAARRAGAGRRAAEEDPGGRESGVPGIAAIVVACLVAGAAADATAADGGAASEEEWRGVVTVASPVVVAKGATLTIRAGTRVLLSGDDRDGDGRRDGYIQVFGTLRVEGERDRPVSFVRLDPDKPWEEVFLSDATSVVRNAIFAGGRWGLHIHGGDVAVEHALFRENDGGARVRGRGASFVRCTFRGNGIGLRFWEGGPTVSGSIIAGNGTGLFYREGPGGARITGNRIGNRDWDLKVGDWATGEVDASGNFWENGVSNGVPRRYVDYRDGRGGRVVFGQTLAAPPRDCGAAVTEGR